MRSIAGMLIVTLQLLGPGRGLAQEICPGDGYDGVNQLSIAWDGCWVEGGVGSSFRQLQCSTSPSVNLTYRLHFQFRTNRAVSSWREAVAVVTVETGNVEPLPPFHRYEASGCAGSGDIKGVSMTVFPSGIGCTEGGLGTFCSEYAPGTNECNSWGYLFEPDTPCPGFGRFVLHATRTQPIALEPGYAYWLWSLNFSNRLRTTCSGCGNLFLRWDSLALRDDDNEGTICFTGADDQIGPDQAALIAGPVSFPLPGCTVSTRSATWGRIKALFR